MKNEGTLSTFNVVDVEQTAEYVCVHVSTYIDKMLKAHGWHTDTLASTRLIEPLSPTIAEKLNTLEGPKEGTKEYQELQIRIGFSY